MRPPSPPSVRVFNMGCLERNISIEDRTRYCYEQKVAVLVYFSLVQRVCRIKKAVENYYDGHGMPSGSRARDWYLIVKPQNLIIWLVQLPSYLKCAVDFNFVRQLPFQSFGFLKSPYPFLSINIVFYDFSFLSSSCSELRNIFLFELICLGCGLDGREMRDRVQVGVRFFSSRCRLYRNCGSPILLPNVYWRLFLRE
jgi:hypothetical protein